MSGWSDFRQLWSICIFLFQDISINHSLFNRKKNPNQSGLKSFWTAKCSQSVFVISIWCVFNVPFNWFPSIRGWIHWTYDELIDWLVDWLIDWLLGECVEYYLAPDEKLRKQWSKHNNEKDCTENGGKWMMFTNYLEDITSVQYNNQDKCKNAGHVWGIPLGSDKPRCLVKLDAPHCGQAPWTRDNHLGNTPDGVTPNFTWTIPRFPSGLAQLCIFRIRWVTLKMGKPVNIQQCVITQLIVALEKNVIASSDWHFNSLSRSEGSCYYFSTTTQGV